MTQADDVFGWGLFATSEAINSLDELLRREGDRGEVFFIAPDLAAIAFATGVWASVNAGAHSLIDQGEDDYLNPEVSLRIALQLEKVAGEGVPDTQTIVRHVATVGGTPVIVGVDAARLRGALRDLAAFLRRHAETGRTVYVQF